MPQEAVHHRQEIPGFGFAAEKWLLKIQRLILSGQKVRGHPGVCTNGSTVFSPRAFTSRCQDVHVRRIY